MTIDKNGEEYVIFSPALVSYIARCKNHKKWDCNNPRCSKYLSDVIDRIIKRENNGRIKFQH